MIKRFLSVVSALTILSLTGCSMFSGLYHKQSVVKNRDYDYLHSYSAQPLQVPAGVSNTQIGNDYPIPGNDFTVPASPASLVPPGSLVAKQHQS